MNRSSDHAPGLFTGQRLVPAKETEATGLPDDNQIAGARYQGTVDNGDVAVVNALVLLGLAGMAGNLICFIKRLFDPTGQMVSAGGPQELLLAAGSYALFGLVAGVIGGVCGWALFRARRS